MALNSNPSYNPKIVTATGVISNSSGMLGRFVVSSTTAGTLTIYDGTSATGQLILQTFTPAAGQVVTLDAAISTGIYVVVGGTIACTFLYI